MRKKVLILSSSPRKGGNSDTLCDQFLAGALEAGHAAEKVSLREKVVGYCTGCGACTKGGRRCPQKDDAAEILDQMVQADVIVMATPVYFYSMAAQMKTLIDRACARYQEIRDKEFYFVVAAADGSRKAMHRTLESFRGFTSCLGGAQEKGVVYDTGAWEVGDIQGSPAMKEAYQMGMAIWPDLEPGTQRPVQPASHDGSPRWPSRRIASMYAVGLNSFGGPEVLHLVELPDPHPAPGQVRVKVRAAGINPVDVLVTLRPGHESLLDRGIRALFVNVREHVTDHAAMVSLGQQASRGLLPMRVAAMFPAAEAAAAHRRFAKGGLRGRLVLDFDGLPGGSDSTGSTQLG